MNVYTLIIIHRQLLYRKSSPMTFAFTTYSIFTVSCNLSTTPSDTIATFSSNGTVSLVMYTCASGFTLSGTSIQTCLPDGAWSDTVPTCGKYLSDYRVIVHIHQLSSKIFFVSFSMFDKSGRNTTSDCSNRIV